MVMHTVTVYYLLSIQVETSQEKKCIGQSQQSTKPGDSTGV